MAQKKNPKRAHQREQPNPRRLHAVSDTASSPTKPTSPGKQALLAALRNRPLGQDTAAELAKQAQIGQSTARRLLGELTDEGLATRVPGCGRGPGRTPAQFSLPTDSDNHSAAGTTAVASLAVVPPQGRANGDNETNNTANNAPEQSLQPNPGKKPGITAGGDGAQTRDDAPIGDCGDAPQADSDGDHADIADPSGHDPAPGPGARVRLGKNALRGKVEQYLLEHAEETFGPHALGQALGHSSGAISNVLDKLVKAGHVSQTQASPKRFTANTGPDT